MKIQFRPIYEKVREGFYSNAIIKYYKRPCELLSGKVVKYKKAIVIDFYLFEIILDY